MCSCTRTAAAPAIRPTGEWAFWSEAEQTDLYDMIEWIAVQDWCTGKVGMLGESLLAWVQWFAACQQPPQPSPASCRGTPAPTCTATWPGTAA